MDADRFDAFVHALAIAVPASRRAALAAALAALLTRIGAEDAAARKKRRKKKKTCKGGTKKCGKACIPKTECCGGCNEDQQCCDGTCRDLATNGANCGACGHACASGLCVNGACTCQSEAECFVECTCSVRLDGGSACRGGFTTQACTGDGDCPLGTFCGNATSTCSTPCLL